MVTRACLPQPAVMGARAGTLDVLIVDDSCKFAESLATFIAELDDVRTFRACSAAEALARARELRPAVILMDAALPDGSGLDATRQIVAEQPGVAIIVMTLQDDPAYKLRALEAGARAFIAKPRLMVELNDVLAAIRSRRDA
jgi:DNA-binding NarL/FixJ family response regulator